MSDTHTHEDTAEDVTDALILTICTETESDAMRAAVDEAGRRLCLTSPYEWGGPGAIGTPWEVRTPDGECAPQAEYEAAEGLVQAIWDEAVREWNAARRRGEIDDDPED